MSTLTNDPAGAPARPVSARLNARETSPRRSRAKAKFLIAALVIVAAVGYMMYAAFQSGSEYYTTTTELKAMGEKAIGQQMKIGGRVVDGSIQWDKGSNTVSFALTDEKEVHVPVVYTGVVPDSFASSVDVILEGKPTADGHFQANTMLAKCASKYEPK